MSNIILAIDTSLNSCSVAIYKNNHIHSLIESCNKTHTKKILPMINQILLYTNTKLSQIHAIALSIGPGNFTSIRIGISIAQSLSLSFNIPLISVSTLIIFAEKAWRKYKKNKILVAINANQKQVYWARYVRNEKYMWIGNKTESCINISSVQKRIQSLTNPWTLVGNACSKIGYINSSLIQNINILFPNAKDIIPLALLSIKENKILKSIQIKPNYLNNIL
ncbi:tRNA (adenosine(37)-N6)-threonylcarbamoyltransferase complex dimerization subunit type 1 TsaB [Buchnera aphidicola]|uniref:tRNA (adenosine(37)-N6)-threonylcarbamoyltransferase complex dimerization subunit type 1 TsaB n=1 Tax=Buchnera aphidicola TaxID=9 RepID=UPI003463D342